MVRRKRKKKILWPNVAVMGASLLLLLALGFFGAMLSGGGAYGTVLLMACLLLSAWVQIIAHEGGHLIAGLLTGYGFVSFRIGSVILTRSATGLRLGILSLAGTGGQCLLSPPALREDGTYPSLWYHLGGCLMNLLCALLALAGLLLTHSAWRVWHLCTLVIAVVFALMNGIPLHAGMVDNDGMNALRMRKDRDVAMGMYRQLQINAAIAEGLRLRDMPSEWFECTPAQERDNGIFRLLRQVDMHDLDAAIDTARKLSHNKKINGIYRGMAENEKQCLQLLRGEKLDASSAELKQYRKAMKDSAPVLRAQYMLALLDEQDEVKAAKYARKFDRMARHYPYPNDIAMDRELMNMAREKAGNT